MNNYTDYLAHHGVKGMKWGVRRYQNPDGTRIKRTNKYDINKAFAPTVKGGKDKPNISPAEKMARNVGSMAGDASRVTSATSRLFGRKKNNDYGASKMSDDQLRKAINRMNLENQYVSAMNNKNTSKGKQYADDILDIVGGVAGIAGSAVGTYALLRTIRR